MSSRVFVLWVVLLAVAIAAATSADALSVTYTQVINLGTLGEASTWACDINDLGQVVGSTMDVDDEAFLWENGVMTGLGTPWCYPTAINNAGQIAGSRYNYITYMAFSWENGQMRDLGMAPGVMEGSYAHGINNAGQIVGYSSNSTFGEAFVWENGIRTDLLFPLGSNSYAYAINDAGLITGYRSAGSSYEAFLMDGYTVTNLGTLGGASSYANGINNAGQIVGYSSNGSDDEAFLWENGVMRGLGSPNGTSSYASDINDAGMVVGYGAGGPWGYDAFVWEDGAGMVNLNSLTGVAGMEEWRRLARAEAINNYGDVVGLGLTTEGRMRAFLLVAERVVPEPASVTLLGIGLAGLVCRGMRKKYRVN